MMWTPIIPDWTQVFRPALRWNSAPPCDSANGTILETKLFNMGRNYQYMIWCESMVGAGPQKIKTASFGCSLEKWVLATCSGVSESGEIHPHLWPLELAPTSLAEFQQTVPFHQKKCAKTQCHRHKHLGWFLPPLQYWEWFMIGFTTWYP